MIKEYSTVRDVIGPLIIVDGVQGVSYGEIVQIRTPDDEHRIGQVLEVREQAAVVQVFQGTTGIDTQRTRVRFTAETMKIGVSTEMLGRIFSGLGEPLDGQPEIISEKRIDVNGSPINPYRRSYPRE